jgi:hypothetical protein
LIPVTTKGTTIRCLRRPCYTLSRALQKDFMSAILFRVDCKFLRFILFKKFAE